MYTFKLQLSSSRELRQKLKKAMDTIKDDLETCLIENNITRRKL